MPSLQQLSRTYNRPTVKFCLSLRFKTKETQLDIGAISVASSLVKTNSIGPIDLIVYMTFIGFISRCNGLLF
jgi:hypothetical protein